MKLVITARGFRNASKKALDYLREQELEIVDLSSRMLGPGSSEEDVIEAAEDADAAIIGIEPFNDRVLRACPNLKFISRNGIGYENIDLEYCSAHGIRVVRALGGVESATAEAVMSYILYFGRRVDLQSKHMHEGRWVRECMPGAALMTLGLVGYGRVGREIARKAAAFDMKILYYKKHPSEDALKGLPDEYGAYYTELKELLSQSDYVSLNVPLTSETEKMVNRDFISLMKKGSILINISRGRIADESAIREAIMSNHLGGAAIDVYDKEPCTDSELRGCPDVILTPHTGPYTEMVLEALNLLSAQNIVQAIEGIIDPKYILA